ncbi:MAG: GGDEF domain-containing protein [Paraglaciecola sp.]|nr:GGDEF domain-containing protein [Paraglaciecola sp.]
MDLFTLSAINLLIGVFTATYVGISFYKKTKQTFLLDFALAGFCLVINSLIAIAHNFIALPYILLPVLTNTATICVHLFLLSALHRLFELHLKRSQLVIFAFVVTLLMFLPILHQSFLNRLLFAFTLIIIINALTLKVLYQIDDNKLSNVIRFFKIALWFNIIQLAIRGLLFVLEKHVYLDWNQTPLVHQLGWFGLSIFSSLILTGVLMILSQQRHLELEKLIERDVLTGLLNRFSLYSRLNTEIKRCIRNEQPLALIMFDIDHFKRINDNFGHQTGDHVLAEVAAVTQATFRNYDLIFRMGGEEFLVCLPGVNAELAAHKAELLRQQIQTIDNSAKVPVTISIGYVVTSSFDEVDTMIRHADEALYQAKGLGRNQAVAWGSGVIKTTSI